MKRALEIKNTMEKKAISLSAEMYNSLITGYFRSKKLNKVAEMLNEMQNRVIIPNIVTYGALISGWCKEGMLDKAFTTYFEMKEKGLAPNVVICSTIVSALYRFDMNNDANMLLHKIMDFDLVPGDKSFEKFFEFDMGKSNVKNISDIVDGVVESKRFINNVVYNVAISGYANLEKSMMRNDSSICYYEKVDKAFKLRDEMLTKGVVPDITTYNALLNGLCKSGNVDRAVRLFRKLGSKGVAPNVVTYNTLIDGFMKTGNTREALKLKEKMVHEGIVPSDATYSCLINRVRKNGEVREAAM
ncbi:putative tetratricopeptide-like helical domain superfamily [Helianthus annuus]|nr:putative tetratricopeptide-like helical domain superfamily [Helianthus annuus]